jgi:hypothetical protein
MKRPLFLKYGHKKIVCYIANTSSERANYLVGSDYASLKKGALAHQIKDVKCYT